MNNNDAIYKRLQKLREYVILLKKLHKTPKETFVQDPFVVGNVERYLQLAIQTTLDIGNHIIANLKVKSPEEYREIFIRLGEEKIIPMELAERMTPLASLRNILVHDYLEVDLEIIYDSLKKELQDFEDYAKYIGIYQFGETDRK